MTCKDKASDASSPPCSDSILRVTTIFWVTDDKSSQMMSKTHRTSWSHVEAILGAKSWNLDHLVTHVHHLKKKKTKSPIRTLLLKHIHILGTNYFPQILGFRSHRHKCQSPVCTLLRTFKYFFQFFFWPILLCLVKR